MALHIKSTKSFKALLGISALLISGMAATFSVTGIATLFSGYFITVAMMMGSLELAKIVVASFLARYWNTVSRILKTYFISALIILILITSGGIFGYLSDAYQRNKGDYTLVETRSAVLQSKKNAFLEKKTRLESDRALELKVKQSNQTRADSLTSRGQSISRTRSDIITSDKRIADIEKQISAAEDSASNYDIQIIALQAKNINGELGPLKYISGIFNTDMDTVVKYFIFLLIFVFDPLAVLLYVALNTIIRKESLENIDVIESKNPDPDIPKKEYVQDTSIDPDDETKEGTKQFVDELMSRLEKNKESVKKPEAKIVETKETKKTENVDVIENKDVKDVEEKEHQFYHDEEQKKKSDAELEANKIQRKSANYHPH